MTSCWSYSLIPISAPRSVGLRSFYSVASGLNQTIVAMISSNPARANHPSRVAIALASPEGRASGLRLDSWLMTDNLATVLESEIDSILGRLPDVTAIEKPLKYTMALP